MDELFRSRIKYQDHEDKLYHELTQPTEDIILGRNAALRNNPGAINDLHSKDETGGDSWGRWVASIPYIMYEKAKRDGYDLDCKDQKIAQRELNRFLQSTDGKLCLIQGKS